MNYKPKNRFACLTAFLLTVSAAISPQARDYHDEADPAELVTTRYVTSPAHGPNLPPEDQTPYSAYSADDPPGEFDIERAAIFIDDVAQRWGSKHGCVTCHTNGHYLMAPPEIFKHRPAALAVRDFAEEWVLSWDTNGLPVTDDIVVAPAAFLTINNMQMDGELRPATLRALDQAWDLQAAEGHWPNWVKCNWPPFEQDDHYGVTLMTVAMGMAPASYTGSEPARTGVARLKQWLANNGPEEVHHRAMLLWAGSLYPDLVSDRDRQAWMDELLALQKSSGGWASGDLGRWRQRLPEAGSIDHLAPAYLAEHHPPVEIAQNGDGYGTGFVMFALLQAGLTPDHPQLQAGLAWLQNNQHADGKWYTRSLRSEVGTSNFLTHTGTTFSLKAIAAMERTADNAELAAIGSQ